MSRTPIVYDTNLPVALPCGRRVTVVPLDGHAQKRLSPDREGKFHDAEGAITFALTRCVKTVNGRAFDAGRMEREALSMPTGSRFRAFMAARTLTYGARCDHTWTCVCKGENTVSRDLDAGLPVREGNSNSAHTADAERKVEDARYSDAVLRDGFTFNVPAAGVPMRVKVRVDSGATAAKFDVALSRNDAGTLDGALAQVVELDGKPVPEKRHFEEVLSLPGDALDAIRAVVAMMEPREFIDAADERAWIERTNERFIGYGNEPPATDPSAAEGNTLASLDARDDDAMPTLLVPQGGPRLKMHLRCAHCGRPSWISLAASPDFFLRHLKSALDE